MPKKNQEVKEAMHEGEPSMELPKRNKAKKIWVIVAIIAILTLVGLGIFTFMKVRSLNNTIKNQQNQINSLNDKQKSLEDAATAAAKTATDAAAQAITNAATSSNFIEVKELGFKLPLTDSIRNLNYFVNGNTAFFSTRELQASAQKNDTGSKMFCAPADLPLGAITKFANAADAGPDQQKALPGFVLGYAPPQAACSANATTASLQTTQKNAFVQAFNNAQKL